MKIEENKTYKFKIQEYTNTKIFLDHFVVFIASSDNENIPRIVFVEIPDFLDYSIIEKIKENLFFTVKVKKVKIVGKVITVEPYSDTIKPL
jgi:hypothetical protein